MKTTKELRFQLHNVYKSHDEYLYDRDMAMADQEQAWIDASIAACKREVSKRQIKRDGFTLTSATRI